MHLRYAEEWLFYVEKCGSYVAMFTPSSTYETLSSMKNAHFSTQSIDFATYKTFYVAELPHSST